MGRGGEGAVYQIADRPDMVAKIFLASDQERISKLRAMVQARTNRLEQIAAWPTELVLDHQSRQPVGFVMPKISGFHDIHLLYGPKTRLDTFPTARWDFLVHTATNVARVFRAVHEHGFVVGDVNHGNLLVSSRATVRLIDCDSFQISAGGHTFPCKVGVETHTPPELYGKNFASGVIRTTNHDAFGLAVVIFQLLFLGRHPYSGTYLGSGEMPIGLAIRDGRFVYGSVSPRAQMKPPPHSLPLTAGTVRIAEMFERAFAGTARHALPRPTAADWVEALDVLQKSLKACPRDGSHQFASDLTACPWCELARIALRSGVRIPLFSPVVPQNKNLPAFDLIAVWARIEAVAAPSPPPTGQPITPIVVSPSPEAEQEGANWKQSRLQRFGPPISGMALVVLAVLTGGAVIAIWLVSLAGILFGLSAYMWLTIPRDLFKDAKSRFSAAQAEIDSLKERMVAEAGEGPFQTAKTELLRQHDAYRTLEQRRNERLAVLSSKAEPIQRQRYLESRQIWQANIPGIGAGRSATLQSFGIETAADVTESAIVGIPGFGPVLRSTLLTWREQVERQFRFDPKRSIDPADQQIVDRDFANERNFLESELSTGAEQLKQVARQTYDRRATLQTSLNNARRQFAQAEADLSVLR